jgi:hypothetical protein
MGRCYLAREDLEAALATPLRKVHGRVGVADQVLGPLRLGGPPCNPNARESLEGGSLNRDRGTEGRNHPCCDALGLHCALYIVDDHGELVAA